MSTITMRYNQNYKYKLFEGLSGAFTYVDLMVAFPAVNPNCLHRTPASMISQESSQIGLPFKNAFPDALVPPPRHKLPVQ